MAVGPEGAGKGRPGVDRAQRKSQPGRDHRPPLLQRAARRTSAAGSFAAAAGVDMLHVPHKGAGIATIDVLSGQVNMFCTGIDRALRARPRAGRLRALGLASSRSALSRSAHHRRTGAARLRSERVDGLVAPPKTPPAIVKRLYSEVETVKSQDTKDFLKHRRQPAPDGAKRIPHLQRPDIARYAPAVKAAGIKPEDKVLVNESCRDAVSQTSRWP